MILDWDSGIRKWVGMEVEVGLGIRNGQNAMFRPLRPTPRIRLIELSVGLGFQ